MREELGCDGGVFKTIVMCKALKNFTSIWKFCTKHILSST